MSGLVQLTHGDLFDGPCDLIVLPCSTDGAFTRLVARNLGHFSIAEPDPGELGSVQVRPLETAEHVAQYAAFAVSVRGRSSSLESIERIGRELGRSTHELESVRLINAPLLGAGAGRLSVEPAGEALCRGFLATAAAGAVLNLHVRHEDVLRRLRSSGVGMTAAPLRVLVSYAHGTDAHDAWVDGLYRYLRANAIEARMDRYSMRLGSDTTQWMSNELQMADRVLVICDERYVEKADGRHGGVGWEAMLIQGDLYHAPGGAAGNKYVPIVRTRDVRTGLPKFLRTKLYFHWPPDADDTSVRRRLLSELRGGPQEPPLGALS